MCTKTCRLWVEDRADGAPAHTRHRVRIDSKNENGGQVREDDQLPTLLLIEGLIAKTGLDFQPP